MPIKFESAVVILMLCLRQPARFEATRMNVSKVGPQRQLPVTEDIHALDCSRFFARGKHA